MKKNHTKITDSFQHRPHHILVFRFSSMGDVAMTLPVLKGLLEQNRELNITLVTRARFSVFFKGISRLHVWECDFKGPYRGFRGVLRLFRELKGVHDFNYVVDLHNVLRTWILDFLFRWSGVSVTAIDKGRKDKKELISGKISQQLESTMDRYLEAFKPLALKFRYPEVPVFNLQEEHHRAAEEYLKASGHKDDFYIGLAPFALHELKTWPVRYTRELIALIEKHSSASVYLFGGGKEENIRLSGLSKDFSRCHNAAGRLSLGAELALLQRMRFMITMDSSNMHLSALSGVVTIAIWGATHPYSGFDAYQQASERNIQIPKSQLSCRPCTVFGKGKCRRKDFACMNWLTPDLVFQKLMALNLIEKNN